MNRRYLLLIPVLLILASCARQPQRHQVTDPRHGKELWLATGPISGTGGTSANGIIQGHYFQDGTMIEMVNINIAPAGKKLHYVAWAVRQSPPDKINLGALQNPLGDARHSVTYSEQKDLRDHIMIEVTQENARENTVQSKLVAIGVLKVR